MMWFSMTVKIFFASPEGTFASREAYVPRRKPEAYIPIRKPEAYVPKVQSYDFL